MDVLADLATTELVQAKIQTIRTTNTTLHSNLVKSQDHCRRLEEEASLQLSVERQHDEMDEAFKKRKQSIYNRRCYKRQKETNGSDKEERRGLITELESLRGQLIECQEKCDRLAEEGIFPVVERLPGESDLQLRKRRQQSYNHHLYLKRKKQMQVQKGVLEP
jgi:hypothetical protein